MKRRGVTQISLAEYAGVSQGAVSRWVNGSLPKADKIERIASCLGVSVEWLLHQSESTLSEEAAEYVVTSNALERADRVERRMEAFQRVLAMSDEEIEKFLDEFPSKK